VKPRKTQFPFFFKLICGETVQNFRTRLEQSLGAWAKHAPIVELPGELPKEFHSSDVLWDLLPWENPYIGVVTPRKRDGSLKIAN
jgi:hypothetical protein